MSGFNPVDFTKKRLQAQRNAKDHVSSLLYDAAKEIVYLASTYRAGFTDISHSADFVARAEGIVSDIEVRVESYTRQYALASCRLLGISTDVVTSFLDGKSFGKTFADRNGAYLATFAQDIIKMCSAAYQMGYTQNQLLSAVRTGYRAPFATSVITKAQRKGIAIATPSYGRGLYHSAYQNIIRNVQATIAIAWGKAENEYGSKAGFVGFFVHRGSSYPCETCQEQVGWLHRFGDEFPPFHNNCVCYITFVDKTE